jgi:DNA-binding GntR family transcriptional regulator
MRQNIVIQASNVMVAEYVRLEGVIAPVLTRTEEVYDVLRADLLGGVLHPGQKLRMVGLAERFSVSQSVVREALTRLAEEGLVVSTPQRGFRVRELSVEDITNLTETRVHIESIALRLSFERGDVQWETTVLAAHHTLERTPPLREDGTVNQAWFVQHRDFHTALLAGCGNPRLEAIAQSLRDSAELYRRCYSVLAGDHRRDIPAEHRQLKELALARYADAAVGVLTEHIERAPRQLIEYAREHEVDHLH